SRQQLRRDRRSCCLEPRREADFLNRLKLRVDGLTPESSENLVRTILKADLMKRLDAEFAAGPRALLDRYRTWAGKYATPLLELGLRRSASIASCAAMPASPMTAAACAPTGEGTRVTAEAGRDTCSAKLPLRGPRATPGMTPATRSPTSTLSTPSP